MQTAGTPQQTLYGYSGSKGLQAERSNDFKAMLIHCLLTNSGASAPRASPTHDAIHLTKGARDQGPPATASVGDGASAGTSEAAAGAAAGGAAASDLTKLRSFRLSFEDIVQEEALEEELDDTLKLSPTGSGEGLDGSKRVLCV